MAGEVVSVLNMKGGVGKTTISAHVMRVLYHLLEKKVLLIDLDPQFNLTQCLMTRAQYDLLKSANRTIFSVMETPSTVGLFDVAIKHPKPPAPSELVTELRNFKDKSAYLHLIPGNFELVKYSLIDDHQKLAKVQTRFLQFIAIARAEYDLVVIDCNPSSSFLTLCALHACSKLLVPVRPDRYSILGLELVADFIGRIPTIEPNPAITVLLNGIPTQGYDAAIENELRAHATFGRLVLTQRLRQSKLLVASSDYTGFATDKPVPYKDLLKTEIAVQATAIECAGCISLGLVRPAIFSIRSQLELLLAWIYFNDHEMEWLHVENFHEDYPMRASNLKYMRAYNVKFADRFALLAKSKNRKNEDPYGLLSTHVHGTSAAAAPAVKALSSLVQGDSACEDCIKLQGEIAEYLTDILSAWYADKWHDFPDKIKTSLQKRLQGNSLSKFCAYA
jgi:chromosome partitioning protein